MSKHKGPKPSPDQRKNRRPKPKTNRKPVLFILLIGLVGVVGYLAFPYLKPAPEVVHPQNPAAIDPAVTALIEPMIAAAAANPRDPQNHLDLALAYEANLLWDEARLSYANALSLNDDPPEWHNHYAVALRQTGQNDEAFAYLQKQARRYPDFAPLQHRLAENFLENGQLAEADAAFRNVIRLKPRAPQGYTGLGDVLLQQQAAEPAIQVLEQALELKPDYKPAYYLLGRAYSQVGRTEEADAALVKGLNASTEFLPDQLTDRVQQFIVNVTGRLDLAGAYLDAGYTSEAAGLLEETLQFHPSHVMLLNTLATAYLRTNRLDDAHRLLNRARDIDRETFFTYLNLHQWALRSRDFEQALSFADQAIERAPDRDDTHLARAQSLMELGRLEEALASADKARSIDNQKAANHGLSGEIAYRLEQYHVARGHLNQAVALQPNLLPSWIGLARVNTELNDLPAARTALAQAQRIAPNHPMVMQLAQQMSMGR